MNIAIVDDRFEDLSANKNFLKKYLDKNFSTVVAQIEAYLDAEKFLSSFERGKYDLLIFDISMKPLNGIQVAQIVRSRDRDVAIVFVTNSEDYLLEGYQVFAVGYFLKPLSENVEQFAKTFAHVFDKIQENQKSLTVKISGGLEVRVPYKNIRYVDINEHHHVCFHLVEKDIPAAISYEECYNALSEDPRFVECYHRIIVNMDFIRSMDGDDFILTDGVKIPISQRKSRASKSKYVSYLIHQ